MPPVRPGLVALVLALAVVTLAAPALAADTKSSARDMLSPSGMLPPTAPAGDFNTPSQSSSSLIAGLHVRGPEKVIGTAVVVLLLVCVVMFAGMLRQAYGGPRARH
jgi:hypothetical protein